jgi:putative aldouronate transport system substrate-binding protein
VLPIFGTGVNPPFAYVKDFEEFAGDYVPGAVMKGDAGMKAVNQWEVSTELKEQLKVARSWYQKGIFPNDIAVLKDQNAWTTAGKVGVLVETTKPGADVENAALLGLKPEDIIDIKYGNAYMSATACQATLTAVSSTSQNPERAVMFLNLINTDKELYNTMCFGVENKHYKKINENTVEAIANSGYDPNRDWEFGNQFNAYFRNGQKTTVWEETKKMNEESEASPLLGFSFDQTPVKTEIAQCTAIVAEYKPLLLTGTVDPEKKLPEMLEKLKKAGSEKIIAELQSQIDKFKASK